MILDVMGIVFSCVTANHLGLIGKLEEILGKLPLINCPKCFTFWCVLTYMAVTTRDVIPTIAVSFLASYIAIWLELLEGYIDTLYLKLYGKIIATDSNDTDSTGAERGNSAVSVS